MALGKDIKETTYLRDEDGGITVLSGSLAEVPEARDGDVIPADVALKELAADADADAKFRAKQNEGAAKLRAERVAAVEDAADLDALKVALLDLHGGGARTK